MRRGESAGERKPQEECAPQDRAKSGARFLAAAEHVRTRALWEEAFPEDSPRFLEYYKACMADHNRILADEESGEIVSMIHLNPYRVMIGGAETGCTYLVAVATKKEFRHQGRMRRLLRMALMDCRKRGEPFAYLMPASEKIYAPFGFRTAGWQDMFTVGNAVFLKGKLSRTEDAVRCAPARYGQLAELAAFSERMLSASCAVYAKRDLSYFKRIWKEQEAINGELLLFYRGEILLGYCRTGEEDSLEIRELLLGPPGSPGDNAAAVRAACGYLKERLPAKFCGFLPGTRVEGFAPREYSYRPVTMVRIADPEAFAGLLRAKEKMEQTLELTDAFLPENSGLWRLELAPGYGRMRRLPAGTEHAAGKEEILRLTIEEFTDAAFGVCRRPDLCRGLLQPLSPVFLQELV